MEHIVNAFTFILYSLGALYVIAGLAFVYVVVRAAWGLFK